MTDTQLLTYVFACFAIIIVPGPTVTVIIANSLRKGAIAGLMNVAGTQVGLIPMILLVAFGIDFVIAGLGQVFDWIKLIGAAYLIYLGVMLIRSDGDIGQRASKEMTLSGYFWQGLLVIWANPKALFFFGAFIPQFVDPTNGSTWFQVVILGAIFITIATLCDGAYVLMAGQAKGLLSKNKVKWLETGSGICLVSGGIWLALAKRN